MSPEILAKIKAGAPSPAERGEISTATIIKFSVDILIKVIARLVKKRGHGIYPTIVEEILRKFYLANVGKLLWDLMKKDTQDSFGRDGRVFGGTAFIAELKSLWESGHQPRILLVGHSAGSIFISHFLNYANKNLPEEIKFDVVFLAPAIAVDLFAQTIDEHGRRINQIRQFTMQDVFEKKDHLVPVIPIYPYSLLYFVSGILEDEADKPLVGMQRFYNNAAPFQSGSIPDLDTVRDFLTQPPERTIWSEADLGPGLASLAVRHVDFDDVDETTIQSVQHIIRAGF
jgi:hypothetical protein